MASVFKAYQPGLNRDVALKVLPPSFATRGDFTERFTREAQAIGNLHHPNILPVYDSGQDKGYSYLVMRYIPNASTLADEMKRPLKTGRVIELISQIAAALDHAHQAGIIHRDIKPSNVLLDGKWALLSDFGLAKMVEGSVELTETGVGMGTPAYMSPEQGMGKKVDHRTDIYALGIILYEMLTGQVLHRAETPIATVMKRINEPLPRRLNPNIPEAVERVILKALAVDPGHRFASAGELAQALKAAFGERPDEVLAEVNEAYVQPASKTAAPVAQATNAPAKDCPWGRFDAGRR
jgi:serine/threonine-protein kinase